MGVATQNCLRSSRLGKRRGLFDWLNGNERAVFGPNRAFDYHDTIFDVSTIGHDKAIIACFGDFAKRRRLGQHFTRTKMSY